jgi:hypothetical protein
MMRLRLFLAGLVALVTLGLNQAALAQAPAAQAEVPIRLGQTVHGELAPGHPAEKDGTLYDSYVFEGRAGQQVAIDFASRAFDTYLVLKLDGQTIAKNDNASRRREDSRIVATLPKDGRYLIAANAYFAGAEGAYTLTLSEDGKVAAPKPRPLAIGKSVDGRLEERTARAPDDSRYDLYRFRAKAGDKIEVNLKSDDFDAYLSLHRAGETADLAFDDNGGGRSDAMLAVTLPAAGEYDIWANAAEAGELGAYRLSLTRKDQPIVRTEPRIIAYGDTVRGELAKGDLKAVDNSYYDVLRFRGEKGDEVKITMRSSTIDSYLSLHTPGQVKELVAANDDGLGDLDAELGFVLPAAGQYEIWANALGAGEVGAYVVSIERIGRQPGQVAQNAPAKLPQHGM